MSARFPRQVWLVRGVHAPRSVPPDIVNEKQAQLYRDEEVMRGHYEVVEYLRVEAPPERPKKPGIKKARRR